LARFDIGDRSSFHPSAIVHPHHLSILPFVSNTGHDVSRGGDWAVAPFRTCNNKTFFWIVGFKSTENVLAVSSGSGSTDGVNASDVDADWFRDGSVVVDGDCFFQSTCQRMINTHATIVTAAKTIPIKSLFCEIQFTFRHSTPPKAITAMAHRLANLPARVTGHWQFWLRNPKRRSGSLTPSRQEAAIDEA
jgi:hypothetical protein